MRSLQRNWLKNRSLRSLRTKRRRKPKRTRKNLCRWSKRRARKRISKKTHTKKKRITNKRNTLLLKILRRLKSLKKQNKKKNKKKNRRSLLKSWMDISRRRSLTLWNSVLLTNNFLWTAANSTRHTWSSARPKASTSISRTVAIKK